MSIIRLDLNNNAVPLIDAAICIAYHTDHWDDTSIVNDGINILLKTPIVHFKSMEYNFAKLVNDSLDKDKSKMAIAADTLNFIGSVLIFAADCTPAGIERTILLNTLGRVGKV